MDVREASPDDAGGIRKVARESLVASYSHALDEEVIEDAVGRWYGDDLEAEFDDPTALFVVVVEDGEVLAFSQSYLGGRDGDVGEINWLHVDPAHRERGLGVRLLERTEEELVDRGATRFRGMVLAANEEGAAFYELNDYEDADAREIEIGGETYTERIFEKWPGGEAGQAESTAVPLDERTLDDGTTVYVAYDEGDRASLAPMYAVYLDDGREERYGYLCGSCESFDTAMDAMGRIECNDCGNRRKATRWDAAYL
ncbi:GNAT family N-acetyltransferase [Halegenticoccus tardaugens]|uniref:GNAT family N-acetyltransferase n=1 Tax=Halegenticoccus tardaugens TaxID=2071624 RepID=UPI00100C241B|nr:GNAT family N-acetyltransferase [Halegenticoccus tardaugens]